MVRVRRVVLVSLLTAAVLSACSSPSAGPPAPSAPSSTIADESEGARVFRTRCSACHGPEGEGNLGPSLIDIAARMPVEEQLTIVRNGKGIMPPFQPALTDAEIAAVVEFVRVKLG